MGGRGRSKKNTSKTPVVERKLTDIITREQGKQTAKAKKKMQEEDLDLESDNDLNWPDLSSTRTKLATLVSPITLLTPKVNSGVKGLAVSTTSICGVSTSKAQSYGTINANLPKEQRNAEIDSEKNMHDKKAVPTGNGERSWAGLLHENKFAAKGMNLSCIPPVIQDGEVVVQLLEEYIAEENQKWNRAIFLYVVGNTPTIGAIERFIASQWSKARKPKVLFHNDGYFIILMNSSEERDEVLRNGLYTMNSRPIILRPWTEGFDFNEEVLCNTPKNFEVFKCTAP